MTRERVTREASVEGGLGEGRKKREGKEKLKLEKYRRGMGDGNGGRALRTHQGAFWIEGGLI